MKIQMRMKSEKINFLIIRNIENYLGKKKIN